MKSEKHCIVIPTNRECLKAIESYYNEAVYAQETLDLDISMIIVDTAPEKERALHTELLKDLDKKIPVFYFDPEGQNHFLQDVLTAFPLTERVELYEILNPVGCSYGAAANKTFLFAAAAGCNYVHRRDSDTQPQKYDDTWIFPIEIEAKYLNTTIDTATHINDMSEYKKPFLREKLPIFMVGGNYLGDWASDLKEIYDYNPELLYEYASLGVPPGKSRQKIIHFLHERYIDDKAKKYTKDTIELVARKIIEVGNHAIYKIFKNIPLIPAKDAVSTDYFYHNILSGLELPMLYHNRHVHHFYTHERKEITWFLDYHMRFVKHRGLYMYINEALKRLKQKRDLLFDDIFTIRNPVFINTFKEISNLNLDNEIADIYSRIIEIFNKIKIPKYTALTSLIKEKQTSLINSIKQDCKDYLYLITHWENLCSFVKNYKMKPV